MGCINNLTATQAARTVVEESWENYILEKKAEEAGR